MKVSNYPPIEDSVRIGDVHESVTERYFEQRYLPGEGAEDHCVLFHSNRICIITLAPSHPVCRDKKTITNVNFQVSTNVDRLSNKVTGKGKRGAQFLNPDSVLCFIECADNTKYTVRSCIRGKLVEMNSSLIEKPELLVEKPNAEGYIAIVLPQIASLDKQKEELLTLKQYKDMTEKVE